MIEGGWTYVWSAYAVTVSGLIALAVVITLQARRWAARARALDANKRAEP